MGKEKRPPGGRSFWCRKSGKNSVGLEYDGVAIFLVRFVAHIVTLEAMDTSAACLPREAFASVLTNAVHFESAEPSHLEMVTIQG